MQSRIESYVGDDAQNQRALLSMKNPISYGKIIDWDTMENIWNYIFNNELGIKSNDHPVLSTEYPLTDNTSREKMCETMFEKCNVPSLFISNESILPLYGSGKLTGVVVSSGHDLTSVVPIVNGHTVDNAIKLLYVAGKDISEKIIKNLEKRDIYLGNMNEKLIANNIKENYCYVAMNYIEEDKMFVPENKLPYTLPDGKIIEIGKERFNCPELLFHPDYVDLRRSGIQNITIDSIGLTPREYHDVLYDNIFLTGGSTLIPGFPQRYLQELTSLAPKGTNINIFSPPEREQSAWIGGSIIAQLEAFESFWITKEEYLEFGTSIANKKRL